MPSRRPPTRATSRRAARARVAPALVLTLLVASGCHDAATPPSPSASASAEQPSDTATTSTSSASPAGPPAIEVVASGLRVPWEVVVVERGRVFLTQRDTGVVSELGGGGVRELRRLDGVVPGGEGGLLGLALSPTFARDGLLYAYFTAAEDNRVVRFSVERPDPAQILLSGIPKAGNHNGGRIAFGPDGMLYIGTGDAGQAELAQSPRSLAGKILRVAPDGSVPGDNPFPDSPVWSLGHRNVQGLAWDDRGRMWAAELGPDRDDEINHIVRGGNYGWPEVTGATRREDFRPALAVKQPSEAAWSGLAFVSGEHYPEWGDSLIAAGLRGRRLWRFPLTPEGGLGEGEPLFSGEYGRLRAAITAPDGSLWFTTSNHDGRGSPTPDDDRLLRYGPLSTR